MIFGKEVGKNGTPHLQGYVYSKSRIRWTVFKKAFPRAHFEIAKGTPEQNIEYCSKEDENPFEKGKPPKFTKDKTKKAGDKNAEQWKTHWELAKSGKIEDILNPVHVKTYEYIHVKYGQKVQNRDVLYNFWIWGPTGTGKSHSVRTIFNDLVYNKQVATEWWDTYAQHPVALLDDVDPQHNLNLRTNLKIWADHYSFNAQVKGSVLSIRPKVVIVTSQYTIEEVFPGSETSKREEKETQLAIQRRFGKLPSYLGPHNKSAILHLASEEDRENVMKTLQSCFDELFKTV